MGPEALELGAVDSEALLVVLLSSGRDLPRVPRGGVRRIILARDNVEGVPLFG